MYKRVRARLGQAVIDILFRLRKFAFKDGPFLPIWQICFGAFLFVMLLGLMVEYYQRTWWAIILEVLGGWFALSFGFVVLSSAVQLFLMIVFELSTLPGYIKRSIQDNRARKQASRRVEPPTKLSHRQRALVFFVLVSSIYMASTILITKAYFESPIPDGKTLKGALIVFAVIGFGWSSVAHRPIVWIYLPTKLSRWERFIGVITILFIIVCTVLGYAEACRIQGIQGPDGATLVNDATSCLYFSIVTWTTLGYGDFHPAPGFRLIAASEAFVGYVFMALLIAALTYVVTAKDPDDEGS
jgi:hypothetical protein